MEENKMKNLIVLKNLPSNIIEEAFIVLKDNKKVKNIEYTNKFTLENKEDKSTDDYIIKEAEMVVEDYISRTEKQDIVEKRK